MPKTSLKFIAIGLSVFLTGCATTSDDPDVNRARTSIWLRENIFPIMEKEPSRAANIISSRFNSMCMDGITLGEQSFQSNFKNTEKSAEYTTCLALNGNLVVAYWKAGNHSAIRPHLLQVLRDGFRTGWKTYGETRCNRHLMWYIYVDANPLEEYKNKIPPWYEIYKSITPKEGGASLYKRYLCMLHNEYENQSKVEILAQFKQEVKSRFGENSTLAIDNYYSNIFTPLNSTLPKILTRNVAGNTISGVNSTAIYVERITLYKNALQHIQRTGLDKTVYENDPVFVSHINSLISEAQEELARSSH
jgi:hypothetical protein